MGNLYPVVLAGGLGSRLWPLSRNNHPKQFLDPLEQGASLLQSALSLGLSLGTQPPLVIADERHRFLLSRQMGELCLGHEHILLESEGKNTASSVLLAAFKLYELDEQACLFITPADHYLSSPKKLKDIILQTKVNMSAHDVCLVGIEPNHASEQYGYLEIARDTCNAKSPLQALKGFKEKPSAKLAESYILEGCLWNAGMVLAKASLIIELFKQIQPALYKQVKSAYDKQDLLYDFKRVDLCGVESNSFDYAILEQVSDSPLAQLKAVKLDCEWDDLGNWPSLLARRQALGLSEHVFTDGKPIINFSGHGLLFVNNHDLVCIADPKKLADSEQVNEYLAKYDLLSLREGLEVFRPWGEFKVLSQGEGFLVKQLSLLPKHKISLQCHEKRAEHWVVVSGIAQVQLDDEHFQVKAGEAVTIKKGQLHRLYNDGSSTLQIIEVQTGLLLDESDIVRYDDSYDRHR